MARRNPAARRAAPPPRVPKKRVEERRPVAHREGAVRCLAQLAPRPAAFVPVHDDDGAELRLALRLGPGELARVEGAVAAAADDDHVPHPLRHGSPPVTGRISPEIALASSLAR